jgi:serine/threonine protein kinase
VFNIVPAVPLSPLLPNLPPSSVLHSATTSTNGNALSEEPTNSVLNLLKQFLVYPPGSRIRAADALRHPWFTSEDSIMLLPKGYSLENDYHHMKTVDEWQGKPLEEWLHLMIVPLNPV